MTKTQSLDGRLQSALYFYVLFREADSVNLPGTPPADLYTELTNLIHNQWPDAGELESRYDAVRDSFVLPLFLNSDFLISRYQTLLGKNERKKSGSFYTPPSLATGLSRELKTAWYEVFNLDAKESLLAPVPDFVLDPAMGVGDLLVAAFAELVSLGVPEAEAVHRLAGYDIDPVALAISRYRIWQLVPSMPPNELNLNLADALKTDWLPGLDANASGWIITNPPWSTRRQKSERKNYAEFNTARGEFCLSGLFLEKAASFIAGKGGPAAAAFLIPDALSKIASHKPVRQMLSTGTRLLSFTELGDPFKGVMAPCASLVFTGTGPGKKKIRVNGNPVPRTKFIVGSDAIFNINYNRSLNRLFDEMDSRLPAMQDVDSTFFLGIVTGNNSAFVSPNKETNIYEPVLGGKNIHPLYIQPAQQFIRFEPGSFQQVCPEDYFRRPKLVYRFICKHLVFAVEPNGQVMLNNANGILIDDELPLYYLAALFNSTLLNAYYRYRFRALRVLKNNIRALPIIRPTAKEQLAVESLALTVHSLPASDPSRGRLNERLDAKIFVIYRKKLGTSVTQSKVLQFLINDGNQKTA